MTSPPKTKIEELLVNLKGSSHLVCVIQSAEEPHGYDLHAEERHALNGKEVADRRNEFIAGRAAANRAMHQLGIGSPGPVRRGKLGEPLWPEGVVGSITHSYPWTIAAVGRCTDIKALGIDLESISRIAEQDISEQICTPAELAWVRTQCDLPTALSQIFCGKEALFKALSPLCQRRFDFKDVQLSWLPAKDCFSAELLIDLGKQYSHGYKCDVHTRSAGNWVFAYVIEIAK